MTAKRRANLTPESQRLTVNEVCKLWFRRGWFPIHAQYASFPQPAPDNLYLLEDVKHWFSKFHGHTTVDHHKQDALSIARHGRQDTPRPN